MKTDLSTLQVEPLECRERCVVGEPSKGTSNSEPERVSQRETVRTRETPNQTEITKS